MLSQNTALWLRQNWIQARRLPKAFVSSAGILNLPITSLPVDNFKDRALWCKPTGTNYNMHGWILCRYCATGWFWWISGLRAVTMWSSASFTKSLSLSAVPQARWGDRGPKARTFIEYHKDCLHPTVACYIYMELFNRNMQQIAMESKKISIDWPPVIAVTSRCQGVDRCPAHVRVYSVEQ